jgi:hypothetical protein
MGSECVGTIDRNPFMRGDDDANRKSGKREVTAPKRPLGRCQP